MTSLMPKRPPSIPSGGGGQQGVTLADLIAQAKERAAAHADPKDELILRLLAMVEQDGQYDELVLEARTLGIRVPDKEEGS